MLGGEWLPPSGSFTNDTDWLSVEGNQTFVADSYPLCLTTRNDSTCTPFTLHMHLKKIIPVREHYKQLKFQELTHHITLETPPQLQIIFPYTYLKTSYLCAYVMVST